MFWNDITQVAWFKLNSLLDMEPKSHNSNSSIYNPPRKKITSFLNRAKSATSSPERNNDQLGAGCGGILEAVPVFLMK